MSCGQKPWRVVGPEYHRLPERVYVCVWKMMVVMNGSTWKMWYECEHMYAWKIVDIANWVMVMVGTHVYMQDVLNHCQAMLAW